MFKKFFNRLRTKFSTPKTTGVSKEPYDVYTPKERLIYRYHNGEKLVQADPQVLWRKVQDQGPEMAIDSKVSQSLSKDASKAYQNLLERIRNLFGLKPWNPETGQGLMELEVEEVLDHFLGFVEQVKKNSNPSPTSVTETSAPCEPSSDGSPPTSNTSGCGSTVAEPSTAEPSP